MTGELHAPSPVKKRIVSSSRVDPAEALELMKI